ncbi:hypothetical protein [Streptomyces narbonensis]|uniref:hypothetical protein n=1 Tax=Streptomyces narbonensis TaxID=67333 RepID=UPI00167283D4|nr:hypothetical protein [Streptomyces narbonensis]
MIEVLSHSSAPLSVREIAERLQVEVSDLYLARTFFAYDRVKISAAGTWCLITSDGDESGVTPTVSGSTNDSVRTGSSTEESTDESQESGREEWLVRLRHEIEGILRQASSAMSTSQIADRLARKVRLKTLRQQLGGDPRFRYIGDDRWALKRREARGAGATPTVASIITGQRGHQALPTAVPPPRGRAAVGKLEGVLDTLAETLRKVGHPLSTQILRDRAGGAIDTGVLKQVLSTDARFHLSDRDAWALTEWDMPSYKPIKDLIGDMVDAHGGAVPASEVVKKLTTNFTLKESSLRQAMSSPPFSVKNGFVRRLIDVEEEQLRQARAAQNSTGHQGSDVPTADELVADMGLDF